MANSNIFVVFPAEPTHVEDTIVKAISYAKSQQGGISSWRSLDVPGRFIVDGVLDEIDSCNFLVADITRLNFNVLFEIGYAIGRKKRVVLVLDESYNPERKEITNLGILDTIGHQPYQNSGELVSLMLAIKDTKPLHFPEFQIDSGAPIYILDTLYKTDASVRIISKIKKSRIRFRSFDPKEKSRLSTLDAYRNVAQSVYVIISLISSNQTDWRFNNFRGAIVSGLCYGVDKDVLIFQEGDEPVRS